MNFFTRNKHEQAAESEPIALFSETSKRCAERAQRWLADRVKRGAREPFGERVLLTPELAETLLASNPENRNVSEVGVEALVRDIASGQWVFNGEPLIVSTDGLLADGQHRCLAVVRAARAIETMVNFGVDYASRLTTDQGRAKTVGNYLAMQGVGCSNNAAAAARALWQIEHFGLPGNSSVQRPTKQQVMDYFRKHSGVEDSVNFLSFKGTGRVGGKTTLAVCHYLIGSVNPGRADQFLRALVRGADGGESLPTTSPVFHARERLLGDHRMTQAEKVELIIKAYNTWRAGRRVRKSPSVVGAIPAVES